MQPLRSRPPPLSDNGRGAPQQLRVPSARVPLFKWLPLCEPSYRWFGVDFGIDIDGRIELESQQVRSMSSLDREGGSPMCMILPRVSSTSMAIACTC